jgi:hypothetical protein
LALAYAMSGQKCQVATIRSKVLVDISKAFSSGLIYVMLSKVIVSMYLKIACRLPLIHVMPMQYFEALLTVP